MEIPQKGKSKVVDYVPVFDSSVEKQKMIDGLVLGIKNGSSRFCWHHPFDEVDCTGIPGLVARDVVAEFEAKGWTVEVEDLSDLDGTIVFVAF